MFPAVTKSWKSLVDEQECSHLYGIKDKHSIQVNRILRILLITLQKLKISLILPKIFYNVQILKQHLTKDEFNECVSLLRAYFQDSENYTRNNIPDYLNYRLIKVIDFFLEKNHISKHLTSWLDELDEHDLNLLKAFDLLGHITDQRLKTLEFFELHRESRFLDTFQENETLVKDLQGYENQLKKQRLTLRWKMAAKESIINKYVEAIEHRKETNDAQISEQMLKNSQDMRLIYNASLIQKHQLEEEVKIAETNYITILNNNLKQEIATRDEKNKLILQIQALINKHDQSIIDKMRVKISLKKEYAALKGSFKKFMIKFSERNAEYNVLVRQKKREERRMLEEKIRLLKYNRAARIIQRFFRRYRKEKKSKAKKGKGGKTKGKQK